MCAERRWRPGLELGEDLAHARSSADIDVGDARADLALAIYGPAARKEGVIVATARLKQEVIEHDGPVAVQLFAPWSGHCRRSSSWKAATKALQGKVKLVVVDATAEQQLAQKYGVRGYPTILIFGDNKRKPQPHEGGRDERSLISGLKKAGRRRRERRRQREGLGRRRGGGGGSAKPKPSPPSGPKPSPSSSRSRRTHPAAASAPSAARA